MKPVRFEFQPKTERVNMRLPHSLLESFIRQALEAAVQQRRSADHR